MGINSKSFALILILIMTVSCLTMLTAKPVNAQVGVTNLSIPSFEVTFESPLSGGTITGNNVNLHFLINKTVDYFWVKTVTYYIYLDEDLYDQLNQSINTNNDVILDKTIDLRLENTSQGKHTIKVDVDIEYCPSSWIPLYQSTSISSKVDFIVTDNMTRQTTDSLGVSIYVGVVVVIFTVTISLLLYHRHRKTVNFSKQTFSHAGLLVYFKKHRSECK
jgi:hypothetical protein